MQNMLPNEKADKEAVKKAEPAKDGTPKAASDKDKSDSKQPPRTSSTAKASTPKRQDQVTTKPAGPRSGEKGRQDRDRARGNNQSSSKPHQVSIAESHVTPLFDDTGVPFAAMLSGFCNDTCIKSSTTMTFASRGGLCNISLHVQVPCFPCLECPFVTVALCSAFCTSAAPASCASLGALLIVWFKRMLSQLIHNWAMRIEVNPQHNAVTCLRAQVCLSALMARLVPAEWLLMYGLLFMCRHQELVTELCHHLSVVIMAQANRLAETGLQTRILDPEMLGCRRSEVNQAGRTLSATELQGMVLLHLSQGIRRPSADVSRSPPELAGQRPAGRGTLRHHATVHRPPDCLRLWLGPTGDRRQQLPRATALAEITERHQPELP